MQPLVMVSAATASAARCTGREIVSCTPTALLSCRVKMCIRDRDTTDRNRTSPFAFTGNKFEFRMPGSAENLSDANTILNTAVAKELKGYADELESAEDFTSAVIALVKRTIRDHRRVIFNGNGYTAEWEEDTAYESFVLVM